MVLGLITVATLGAGLVAGAYGVKSTYDLVKYHNKRNQLHTCAVNPENVDEMVHFTELDKQGYPLDGGRVVGDMVRSQAYTTEADATAAERKYRSKLINQARANMELGEWKLVKLHEECKKLEYGRIGTDRFISETIWNISVYKTETPAETMQIYRKVRTIPHMKHHFPFPPKITWVDGEPRAIWHIRSLNGDVNHKYYVKKFIRAAYETCNRQVGPIRKIWYEKPPEHLLKREPPKDLPYWLWTLEEKYGNNGFAEEIFASYPEKRR